MLQIGWPQGLILLFMLIPVIMAVANHGKERQESLRKYNGPAAILRFLGGAALLYWGGFFQ